MITLPVNKNQYLCFRHITTLFLLINSLILSLLFPIINLNQSNNYSIDKEEITSFPIPKLKGKSNPISSSFFKYSNNDKTITSNSPAFAIGNQIGDGEGTYEIRDSLITFNSSSLNLQNEILQGNPSVHNSSFTLKPLANFTQNFVEFQILNATAIDDWRLIENDTTGLTFVPLPSKPTYDEVGQKFEIKEAYANITSVEVYLKYIDVFSGGDYPRGTISIFNDDEGVPGVSLGTKMLESEFGNGTINYGVSVGPAWVNYTFDAPINLTKGFYWIVLNDTGNQDEGYWEWYGQDDSTNGDAGDWVAKNNHGINWTLITFPAVDVLSSIRVLSTDSDLNSLIYSSPKEISMTYKTTMGSYELSSFILEANDTSKHDFYSNTSVSFILKHVANYSFLFNPITAFAMYQVQNGSDSFWNLSFSTVRVNTSDRVQNRTIVLSGINEDWNGSEIYWNDSIIPQYIELTNNPNITWDGNPNHKYSYGNTTMVINASSLIENVTWHVFFKAPNYVSSFDLERNLSKLPLPLKANVTDTLDLIFSVGESGGNASFWIEHNLTKQQVYEKSNISYSETTVTNSWDINNTLDQTKNINGSYELQAFWISTDKNKVGTFIRTIDLFVNTSFEVQADSEVVIGELFTIVGHYKTIHNNTDVKNAKIWCEASWSTATDVFMNQIPSDDSYNATFSTSGQSPGELGNITITTQVDWFVNWTKIVYVYFVANSSLVLNITENNLEWYQNTTIRINYLNSTGNSIFGAMVKVNGINAKYNASLDAYIFLLNTSDYPGVGLYNDIPVTATHSEYLSRQENFSILITTGITNISGTYKGTPIENKTELYIPYANSSADNISINLEYYHIRSNTKLLTSEPEIQSSLPHINSIKLPDNSWTITFNPNQTGIFVVKVTFSLINYYNAFLLINVTVQKANTRIQTDFINNTQVFYSDAFEFSVSFNNTDWNENITFDDQESIIISNQTKLQYLNRTGDYYWFRFSSSQLSLGPHSIQIKFSVPNFQESLITVVFNIVDMPTLAIPLSSVYSTNNGLVLVEDPFGITIENYQTFRGLNISLVDEVILWLNGSPIPEINIINLELSSPPFSFNLSTIGWQYGVYNLTCQLHTIGYIAQNFSIRITLLGRETSITIEIEPGKNIQQGEDIIFIVTLVYNEFSNGFGSKNFQQIPLEGIEITFLISLNYKNGSTKIFEEIVQIDESSKARYTIEGKYTFDAVGFTNIRIESSSGLSALPAIYIMSASELESYEIIPPAINIFEVIFTILIIVAIVLISAFVANTTVRAIRRSRKINQQRVLKEDRIIEKSFEDIKSIRLILARHQSGLQFYVEKTISEFQADTDALSGMSTAISHFIEDVSRSMITRNENGTPKQKIESISREGFHMLIWNGKYSSVIIISEIQLPNYFRERLEGLGHELEFTFEDSLKDFFDLEQFSYPVIKKIVRKYISLHYFSAFILNEGILTLKNIKLTKKDRKMLSLIKKSTFEKKGVQYFFSEQIISYLAKKYKRSEAIKFLEKAIHLELLLECSQEEILELGK
ncbi:MAG: hypothetical protein ACFFAU_13145 [Candidatus Hodarchaeota archaeon]